MRMSELFSRSADESILDFRLKRLKKATSPIDPGACDEGG